MHVNEWFFSVEKLWFSGIFLTWHYRGVLLLSFFSIWVFFHNYSWITGLQGKREGISSTPHYHFHPFHRHLDISQAITAESSPLHIGSSWTQTATFSFRVQFTNHKATWTLKATVRSYKIPFSVSLRGLLFTISIKISLNIPWT